MPLFSGKLCAPQLSKLLSALHGGLLGREMFRESDSQMLQNGAIRQENDLSSTHHATAGL